MYNAILVPLDGSQRAEAVLPYVETLAQCFSSRLILLNVLEPVHFLTSAAPVDLVEASVEAEQIQDAGMYLEALVRRLRQVGIQAESRIMEGPPLKEILRVADEEHVDLIAIASHGLSGLARVFYGSVAVGLVHHADRPLLVIRAENNVG